MPYDVGLSMRQMASSRRVCRLMALMGDTPTPPTALFCANDRMAMGAYDALQTVA